MKICFLSGCLLALTYCSTAVQLSQSVEDAVQGNRLFDHGRATRSNSWLLAANTIFYIARNNQLTALNSAHSDTLTGLLRESVSQNFPLTQVAMMPESYSMALRRAESLGVDFLIFPSISVWDSRVGGKPERAEWLDASAPTTGDSNFGLDRTQVQLMIVHAVTGVVFDVVSLKAEAGLLTTFNNSPQKVLEPQLQALFASLVAKAG